eukprot:331002-Hanusia_phi.AAC.1
MGGGVSIEEYMMDFDEEMPPTEQRRKLEKDLRRGIYIHKEYGEFRIPRKGRYLITCKGAAGVGRDQPKVMLTGKPALEESWDNFSGGGAARFEVSVVLTEEHTMKIAIGSRGKSQGCGGGGTFIANRIVDQPGWDLK